MRQHLGKTAENVIVLFLTNEPDTMAYHVLSIASQKVLCLLTAHARLRQTDGKVISIVEHTTYNAG